MLSGPSGLNLEQCILRNLKLSQMMPVGWSLCMLRPWAAEAWISEPGEWHSMIRAFEGETMSAGESGALYGKLEAWSIGGLGKLEAWGREGLCNLKPELL